MVTVNVMRDDRPTVRGRNAWGVFNVPEDGIVYEDLRVEGGRRHCWSSYNESDEIVRGFVKRNVLTYGVGDLLWGDRLYNLVDALFEDCEYRYVGRLDGMGELGGMREGHGSYCNILGGIIYRRCRFHTSLGQGVQLVSRSGETRVPDDQFELGKLILIDRCSFLNCGAGDRDSYALSIFGCGQRVMVKDTIVRETNQLPDWYNTRTGVRNRSRGAILIGDGELGNRDVKFKRVWVALKDSDRPAVKIEDCDAFAWETGLCHDSGRLDRPAQIYIGPNARNVKIRNVRGNWVVAIPRPGGGGNELVAPAPAEVGPGFDFDWNIAS